MKSLLFVSLLTLSVGAQAAVAVISNPNVGDGVTDKDIKKVFMGKKSELAGAPVTAVDQKEGSTSRKEFYEGVVGQSEDEVKAYRTEMVFTGRGTPPKELADDAAVKAFVAATPGAVGYIDDKKVDASVKVLMKK
jgi:ABC-type phosphate transport system substrate-binding protein